MKSNPFDLKTVCFTVATLLLLMTAPLCAKKVKKASPTKIALVTNMRSKNAHNVMALAEVELASRKNITLLDRKQINKLLEEHELALRGMADVETALRVGKVLSIDLLVILEGDPKAKKQRTMGLVVFDARTGVRLLDEALPSKAETIPKKIGAFVDVAVKKYRSPLKTKKTVSVIGARNVDFPMEKDAVARAIARLLERSLVNSPDVLLLERSSLEHVRRERAVSADAPKNALLASLQMIHVELARAGKNKMRATAILTLPDDTTQRVKVTARQDEVPKMVDQLLAGILKKLQAAKSKRKPDRKADAMRMLVEFRHEFRLQHYDRAMARIEAVLALKPNLRNAKLAAADVYHCAAAVAYDSRYDPTTVKYAVCHTYPKTHQTAESRVKTLSLAIRSVNLLIEHYEQEKKRKRFKKFGFKKIQADPSRYGFSIPGYIHTLEQVPGGRTEEADRLLTLLKRRCDDMMLGILAPHFGECLQGKKFKWGKKNFHNLPVYGVIIANCWKYIPDTKRWTDVMVENAQTVMKLTDRVGPFHESWAGMTVSYIYPLALMLSHSQCPAGQLSHQDIKRFRTLFDKMGKHRLHGMQVFGKVGHLWLDQQTKNLTDEQIHRRAKEIIAFAKKGVENPGVDHANNERMACYEASCVVINSIRLNITMRAAIMDDLLEFMVDRKETMLSTTQFLILHGGYNHGNYSTGAIFPARNTWPYRVWKVLSRYRDREKIIRSTKKMQDLLAKGEIHCIGGRKDRLTVLCRWTLAWYSKYYPELISRPDYAPDPWTKARKLIDISDHPGLRAISKVAVQGKIAYVAGVERASPYKACLFRIPLDGQKIEKLTEIELPAPKLYSASKEKGIHLASRQMLLNRAMYPLRLMSPEGDVLYYAAPCFGSIVAFPVDGTAPRLINKSNTPGMPTDFVDYGVSVDGNILAFSSALNSSPSYVHWYVPKKGTWKVIASSNRLEKKTDLDHPMNYLPGSTYDKAKQRVFFVTAKSLWQIKLKNLSVKKIRSFPRYRPNWYGWGSENHLWLSFLGDGVGTDTSTIVEYDTSNQKWREAFHWEGGEKLNRLLRHVKPAKINLPNHWETYGPFIQVDDWLWSFEPFSRISLKDKSVEQFKERLYHKEAYKNQISPSVNTLQYLPEQRGLLYGNHRSLWYFQLPEKAKGKEKVKAKASSQKKEKNPPQEQSPP